METLVFRRGRWMRIALPFSDPAAAEGHRRLAASVAANWLVRGHSQQAAEQAAEKAMYEAMYPGLGFTKGPSGTA